MIRKLFIGIALAALALTAFDRLAPESAAGLGLSIERSRSGLVEKRIDGIDGFTLHYLEGGNPNAEPLVLIHGIGADKDHFTRVARSLTSRYHVISLDLPGFGESSRILDADYSIALQVERVRIFLRKLGIASAHLGGSSMGGNISAVYAAKYPAEVDSLWLLAPGGVIGSKESIVGKTYRETGVSPLFVNSMDDFPRVKALTMSQAPWIPWSVNHVLAKRSVADFPLHQRIFKERLLASPTLNETLAQHPITAPTLIVWGDDDRVLDVSGAGILHGLIPKAKVIVLAHIGHLPMIEAAERSASDYLAFRDSL